jgi:S-formylglutathione hydrolase FrmB
VHSLVSRFLGRKDSAAAAGFVDRRWHSRALGREMRYLARLPREYQDGPDVRFPTLYLLHGAGHDRLSVLRDVGLGEHASILEGMILIIPDGEQGWWLDSPQQQGRRFATYLLELVAHIDLSYRTWSSREGRGVCGFSMGGFGAMSLAAFHGFLFGSASSLLGLLDILQCYPSHDRLRDLLGRDRADWEKLNPCCHVDGLVRTALFFSTGDHATDRSQNEAFAAALSSKGVPHRFRVHPGRHNTAFVRANLAEHISFHRGVFESARIEQAD